MAIADAAIAELKARNPVDEIAGRWVRLRKNGNKMVGPCPICSENPQSKTAGRFECSAESWVCAVCQDGGDVIALVQKVCALEFRKAVDWLGGPRELSAADSERAIADKEARQRQRDAEAAQYRERERESVFQIWKRRQKTPAHALSYLRSRHVDLLFGCKAIGSVPDLPYFIGSGREAKQIHCGPAMLAAIVDNDGTFSALHMTWLDPDNDNGKVMLFDPENGEALPAKKVRGSKSGGHIELNAPADPVQLIIGEGIETVLSVARSFVQLGRDISRIAFWASVDLGNLGGKAKDAIAHPTKKSAANRTLKVPGPVPDLDAPAIEIPDGVTDVVLLGDGDSDRFTIEQSMMRAAGRWQRPGRTIRSAFAPDGFDFNDVIRGKC